jgi:1,4-dihydroxy-2-naphthoate octaprenyltransferase
VMSYLAASGNTHFDFSNLIFLASVISVFFGYANFVLTGYFKDINADRSTSYNTLPVKFGRKTSAIVSDAFGFIVSTSVFALVIALAFDSFPYQTIIKALIFIYTGIGVSVFTQMNLHSVKSDAEAHRAIAPCVHSYILLLSGLAILNKPDWFISLLIFYLLYIFTLKLRPAKEQI